MKRALCTIICLMCLFLSAAAEEIGVEGERLPTDAETIENAPVTDEPIRSALRRYSTRGAQVTFAQAGDILSAVHYGRVVGGQEEVTDDTVFCLASISKMVTAVGLMQLVEEGMFDLDADISDYLGFYVRNPKHIEVPITLRQILTHTSGLIEPKGYQTARSGGSVLLRDLLTEAGAETAFGKYAPGAKYAYSNFGGALIGVFIEIGSAMPLDAYMNQYVFEPLGITAHYHRDLFPEGTVFATENTTIASYEEARPEELTTSSAGNLWMSAGDLTKILIALAGDGSYDGVSILSPETARAMRTNQSNTGSVTCKVNYGLSVQTLHGKLLSGREMCGHQGVWQSMLCAAFFDESDQTVCVALTNRSNGRDSDFAVHPVLRAAIRAAYATYGAE